jgi:transcriptional regulator with XRE-family HTH domain
MNESADILVNSSFLRKYLKQKELTESQFANEIGVAHSTVNRVLNGKRNPGNKFIAGVLTSFSDLNFEQVFLYKRPLPKGNERSS